MIELGTEIRNLYKIARGAWHSEIYSQMLIESWENEAMMQMTNDVFLNNET